MSASYCLSTSYAPRASASASGSAVASLRVPPQARSARPGRSTAHTASLGFRCDTDAGAPTKAVTLPVIAAAATATRDRRPILPLLVSSRKLMSKEKSEKKYLIVPAEGLARARLPGLRARRPSSSSTCAVVGAPEHAPARHARAKPPLERLSSSGGVCDLPS